jgi:WG containing repeat
MLKRWMSLLGLVLLAVLLTVLPVLVATAEPNQGFVQSINNNLMKTTPWMGSDFSEGLAAVCFDDRGCGYVNPVGQLSIITDYTVARSFHEGMAGVSMRRNPFVRGILSRASRYGFIDKSGKLSIPMKFDAIGDFNDGLAAVKIKRKWGYINKQGRIIVHPKFKSAGEFHDGLASVQIHQNRDAIINRRGKIIKTFLSLRNHPSLSALAEQESLTFSEGLIPAFDRQKGVGYMNSKGKLVIPHQFSKASRFSNGLAVVSKKAVVNNDHSTQTFSGYINRDGRTVVSLDVNAVSRPHDFHEDLARIESIDGCKYIDNQGRTSITINSARTCGDFHEGFAEIVPDIVKDEKNSVYFIDTSGKMIFSLAGSQAYPFHGGLARVIFLAENNFHLNYGYVDKRGRIVFQSPLRK